MSINKRINLLRKQLGMIQQDFANKIGVQRVTISWMEKEGNTITKQNIKIISKNICSIPKKERYLQCKTLL